MEDGLRYHRIRSVRCFSTLLCQVRWANQFSDALGVKLGHRRVSKINHQMSQHVPKGLKLDRSSNGRLRTRGSTSPISTALHQVERAEAAGRMRGFTTAPAVGNIRLAKWKSENINVIRRYFTRCPA